MSTFTQFNGPLGASGPSTKDLTGLIDAYTNLKVTLDRHINDDIDTNNVHRGRDYIDSVKRDIQTAIDTVLTRLNAIELDKVDKPAAGHLVNNTELDNYTTLDKLADELDKYTNTEGMSEILRYYVKDTDFSALRAVVESTRDSFLEFRNYFSESIKDRTFVLELEGIFTAAEYLLGIIHVKRVVDFTEWQTVSMQFAGTGAIEDTNTNGLYVIGKLSDDWSDDSTPPTQNIYKSARAFIKYEDGAPFDAVIDMVVTKHGEAAFTGAINAIISKQPGSWNNLRFHLCRCTDYEGKEAIYLCVSADGLAKNDSNYANWYIHACGINFIPLSEKNIKYVQSVEDCITSTAPIKSEQSSGTAVSNISIGDLYLDKIQDTHGKFIFEVQHITDETGNIESHLILGDKTTKSIQFYKRPSLLTKDPENPEHFIIDDTFATVKDLQSLSGVPLGAILDWPLYEEVYELDGQGNPVISELTGEPVIKMLRAIEVPKGFLATDASDIDSIEYPEYSVLVHHEHDVTFKLPLRDCGIIKVKMDINNDDAAAPERITVLNYNQLLDRINDTRSRLSAEVERSTAADTAHDTAISDETTRATTEEQRLDTAISDEATRATTAETNLATAINDETTRATAAETNLATAVSDEATRATAAETNLNTKINTEATIRSSQVDILDQNKADKGTANPVITFAGVPTVTPGVTYQNGQRAYDSVGDKKYVYKFEETWTVDESGNPTSSQFAGWVEVGSGQWS